MSAITALTLPTFPVSFNAAATPEPVAFIQTIASKSGFARRIAEVDENVFYSKQSKVWQQALNRIHVQKSILLYCFGKLR